MGKWIAGFGITAVVAFLAVLLTYDTVPDHDCGAVHFDTLIVLGCPPDPDGTPSSEERERVRKTVQEFQAGHANNVIVTGGTPHSVTSEAAVMAPLLISAGVPSRSLSIEPQATNTIENIYYSYRIMQQRGWKSAEVVSSPSHVARVALILRHYPICWRTQISSWPREYTRQRIAARYLHEILGTTLLRWFGFRHTDYIA